MTYPSQLQSAYYTHVTENVAYWRLLYRSVLIFIGLYALTYSLSGLISLYIPIFDPVNFSTLLLALMVMSELGLSASVYRNSRWNLMILLSGIILATSSLTMFMV